MVCITHYCCQCQYISFAIPAHNGNVERVSSLMQSKWMKEGSRLSIDSVKGICIVQCSVKNMSGEDFFFFLLMVVVFLPFCRKLEPLISVLVPRLEILHSVSDILTFICLRRSYISYELASRTVRSWRQNSVRCFSQCWPWNALRNRMCCGACCGRSGRREIINAIRWGAWYYSIMLNACHVTSMADTGIDAVKKQRNAEYSKQYRMKRKLLTYKWFGTFIIKDGRYTFTFLFVWAFLRQIEDVFFLWAISGKCPFSCDEWIYGNPGTEHINALDSVVIRPQGGRARNQVYATWREISLSKVPTSAMGPNQHPIQWILWTPYSWSKVVGR
jgi:hypothetical protein